MEIRKRIEDLEALKAGALDILAGHERSELFTTIVERAVDLLDCDAAGTSILDEDRQVVLTPFAHNVPELTGYAGVKLGDDPVGRAIVTGISQRIDDYGRIETGLRELVDAGVRAMAVVALRVRGRPIGALWVAMRRPGRTFSDYDMVLLESIGSQAALAIDNITLFEKQLHIADALQRGFFPEKLPDLRQTDIGIFYASATEEAVVGGDFYDAAPAPDRRIGLFVGDISGKGVAATADAAMAKYTLRAVAHHHPEPSQALTTANEIISDQLRGGHFATLVYLLYDPADGSIKLGAAGHPSPLLFTSSTGQVTPIPCSDPAFALFPDYKYTQTEHRLSSGDMLALYTDGIIELRRDGEFLGTERLGELLAEYAGLPAQRVCDRIMAAAREYSGGRLTDDVVLMVIKRT